MLIRVKLIWLSVYMEEIGPHEKKTVLQGYILHVYTRIYTVCMYLCCTLGTIVISTYEAGMLTQIINIIACVAAKALDREQKTFTKNTFTTTVPSSVHVLC